MIPAPARSTSPTEELCDYALMMTQADLYSSSAFEVCQEDIEESPLAISWNNLNVPALHAADVSVAAVVKLGQMNAWFLGSKMLTGKSSPDVSLTSWKLTQRLQAD